MRCRRLGGLLNRPVRIGGELRWRFDTDEAVCPAARFKNGPQYIRGIPHIFNGNLVINGAGFGGRISGDGFAQGFVVLSSAVNSLFEDSRIARNAAHAILVDQLFQLAVQDKVSSDIVKPDRLGEEFRSSNSAFIYFPFLTCPSTHYWRVTIPGRRYSSETGVADGDRYRQLPAAAEERIPTGTT